MLTSCFCFYLRLVSCLCVFLGGQVVVALTHAAVSNPLQYVLAILLSQSLRVGHGHSLSHLLCDGQVLVDTQL